MLDKQRALVIEDQRSCVFLDQVGDGSVERVADMEPGLAHDDGPVVSNACHRTPSPSPSDLKRLP